MHFTQRKVKMQTMDTFKSGCVVFTPPFYWGIGFYVNYLENKVNQINENLDCINDVDAYDSEGGYRNYVSK